VKGGVEYEGGNSNVGGIIDVWLGYCVVGVCYKKLRDKRRHKERVVFSKVFHAATKNKIKTVYTRLVAQTQPIGQNPKIAKKAV